MARRLADPWALDEPVHLSEWNPDWLLQARSLAHEVASVLPPLARVEHIGSTAVEGLPAKAIVDLMVGAPSGIEQEDYALRLSTSGWEDMGEAGVPGRRHLRQRSGIHANLHVVLVGSPHWENNIALRDFLKAHPAERTAYAAIKASVIAHGADRLLSYSRGKADFMAALLQRATAWRAAGNSSP